MRFKILHTNDVHSRFENFAKIAAKIRELRDENTLVLDAGDFNDFMRIELQGTGGKAGIELLKLAGYDAVAVGNNETFNGLDTLENMASSDFPLLSCNLKKCELKPIRGVRESIILERGGIKFLIIGLSPLLDEFYELSNMGTVDYKEALKNEICKNRDMYDVCILLSHIGLREDRDIAQTVDGIDIIIDGHSHILMKEPEVVNNVVLHMSGCFGENLGVFEFEYEKGIRSFKGENINIIGFKEDPSIMESISRNKERALDVLSRPLYSINMDMWHDVIEENPITNLLADSLKDTLKCDIGLINSGIFNGGIRKGEVSLKKLLEISPSPLNPTYMEVKGRDIREALAKSLYADFCLSEGKGSGFRGRYLGRLHVSGIKIIYEGRRIKSVTVNGEELQDDKWYSVATSDYLQRGTGYESLKNNRNIKYNPEYIRDTLREYLINNEFVKRSFENRWIEA